MTPFESGSRIQNWIVDRPLDAGEGFRVYLVRHGFLGIEGEMRVFGTEFGESPETRKALQRFIQAFCAYAHPALPVVLDMDDAKRWGEGSDYVVFERTTAPCLEDVARERPLDTRERILTFLQALAAMLVDFQGLRFGCDRLTLRDLSWDGRTLSVRGIAWSNLLEGFLRRRLSNLADRWERDLGTGLYPLGEKSYPRLDSLVRMGRLAYEAAGVKNADKRILDAAQVSAAETSASAPPLVESWGLSIEALMRRCLFAHQPGMVDKPETLLDAVEKLMGGETPDQARALPTLTVESVATRQAERRAQPDLPEDRREITGFGSESAHAPTRAFTPLGAEAAALDAPAKAGKRKAHAPKPATQVSIQMSAEQKALLFKIGGAVAGVVVVITLLILVFGGGNKANVPPTAAIASSPSTVKLREAVMLDASESFDPDNDPLTYEWSIEGLGSMDYILEPNNSRGAVKPTLRVFKRGTYAVGLRVFDGRQYSQPVSINITITE